MRFQVIYKLLAQFEASEAHAWYSQPHIDMGGTFLQELERTNGFLAGNLQLYPCVELEVLGKRC